MIKSKVIVIGGGYAGLRALEKLSKVPDFEILLLDKNSYHFMQTDVYNLIANEEDFAQVSVDLFTFCMGFAKNVTFLKQEVTNVDFKGKKVITTIDRYSYDYLVIAVGARTKFISNVDGLKNHSYCIKVLPQAMYFKQKFEMSLFKKVEDSGTNCTPMNIVVAGGGLSGVEIAAQMASYSKSFYKRNNFICRKLNIVLINSSGNILRGHDGAVIKKSQKRLLNLEVVVKNNVKVTEVKAQRVELSNGEVLHMDFMIFAGGIEPNGLVHDLEMLKNEKGYIVSNRYLQSKEYQEVFAIGDCTTIYSESKSVPPTADIAEQMAELCAKNIINLSKNNPLIGHKIKSRGTIIALGKGYAVAKFGKIHFSGYLAYIMKKIVEKIYAKRLDIRCAKGHKKIFSTQNLL